MELTAILQKDTRNKTAQTAWRMLAQVRHAGIRQLSKHPILNQVGQNKEDTKTEELGKTIFPVENYNPDCGVD